MATTPLPCTRTGDAGQYVLGTLHGPRLDSFRRHLRRCGPCAAEVELLHAAADVVPLLASDPVAAAAGERDHERRAPALAAALAARRRATSLAAIGGHNQRRVLKSPMPKPAMVGILGIAIIAAVTIVLSHQAASIRFLRIGAGWRGGGAALKLQGNQLELLVEDMPQPAPGHGYRVWLVDRATGRLEPTSAWLHLNALGQAGVNVVGDYHDWAALAVYAEPLRGTDTTGSGAVIVADLRRQR